MFRLTRPNKIDFDEPDLYANWFVTWDDAFLEGESLGGPWDIVEFPVHAMTAEDVRETNLCGILPDPTDYDVDCGLAPGLYSARWLPRPLLEECEALLVRADGSLGWARKDGSQEENFMGRVSRFSADEL